MEKLLWEKPKGKNTSSNYGSIDPDPMSRVDRRDSTF